MYAYNFMRLAKDMALCVAIVAAALGCLLLVGVLIFRSQRNRETRATAKHQAAVNAAKYRTIGA